MAGRRRPTETDGPAGCKARRGPPRLLGMVLLAVAALALSACQGQPVNAASLLHGRPPTALSSFAHPERMTDGQVPPEGAPWNSPEASPGARGGRVDFDLGREATLRSVWLQADHNDAYDLQLSTDGEQFVTVWTAGPVAAAGLRSRLGRDLDATGRFVRLVPRGGDGVYSVSELLVFTSDVGPTPHVARVDAPRQPGAGFRWTLLWFSMITALWVLLLPAHATRRRVVLTALVPLAGLAFTLVQALEIAPLDQLGISATRASVATIAAAALIRLIRPLGGAVERTCRWVVALSAVVGTLSFFHYGQTQFFDSHRNAPSYVHYFDTRVYFPQAKYFEELGFDGVYAASIAAWADDDPNATPARLDKVALRDLRTHRVVRAGGVRDHIASVRSRFSAARWNELVEDMRYFRLAMGVRDYEHTLLDHGGNATPVWLTFAHLLFANVSASDLTLSLAGLLDPILLIAAFIAVGYAFGPMTALLCALVFGANDYHMGGHTNWAGATLRHDWLAALLCAIAALARKRWMLGGALLSLATALRAFPVLGFLGIAFGAAWALWDARGKAHAAAVVAPALRVLAGAAAAGLALFGLSALVLGPEAWVEWLHKVRLLSGEPHPNHISLELLFSYDPDLSFEALEGRPNAPDWQRAQAATLASRQLAFYGATAAIGAIVALLCRRVALHRAALLGLCLVPVVLYPANYYLHFVCALPALASAPRRWKGFTLPRHAATIWVALCMLCAAQYFTVPTVHLDMHYVQASVLTFAAFAVIFVALGLETRPLARPDRGA